MVVSLKPRASPWLSLSIQEGLHGLPWSWGPAPRGSSPLCSMPAPGVGGEGAAARPAHAGRGGREGGAVTWPDDGFQQGDPSSQDLQPGLLPQEGLEATGLGESERAEQSARSPRGGHGTGGTAWQGWQGRGGTARHGGHSGGAAPAGGGVPVQWVGGARSPRRVSEGCQRLPWPQGGCQGLPHPCGVGAGGGGAGVLCADPGAATAAWVSPAVPRWGHECPLPAPVPSGCYAGGVLPLPPPPAHRAPLRVPGHVGGHTSPTCPGGHQVVPKTETVPGVPDRGGQHWAVLGGGSWGARPWVPRWPSPYERSPVLAMMRGW